MINHVLRIGPGHDLQKVSVYGGRNAVAGVGVGEAAVQVGCLMVHVYAGSHDFNKLLESIGTTPAARALVLRYGRRTPVPFAFLPTGYAWRQRSGVRTMADWMSGYSTQIGGRAGG